MKERRSDYPSIFEKLDELNKIIHNQDMKIGRVVSHVESELGGQGVEGSVAKAIRGLGKTIKSLEEKMDGMAETQILHNVKQEALEVQAARHKLGHEKEIKEKYSATMQLLREHDQLLNGDGNHMGCVTGERLNTEARLDKKANWTTIGLGIIQVISTVIICAIAFKAGLKW